jgi:hypothetical protein
VRGHRLARQLDCDYFDFNIAYPLPGVAWAVSVNMGASVLRGVAGALEFLPGLVLIPFDADAAVGRPTAAAASVPSRLPN